jgi:PAS domain S-box-containing protein
MLIMGLQLNATLTLTSKEVVLASQRTAFLHRLSFLLTELMLGSADDRHTSTEVKFLIRQTLKRAMDIHVALSQGSETEGVPGSASRSTSHYNILYEDQCSDTSAVSCLGLDALVAMIRTNTEAVLVADASAYGRNNPNYRNVLKVDDDVIYYFESKHPTFQKAIDLYQSDPNVQLQSVSTTLWVILAVSLVVFALSYPLILRPSVIGLERECKCVVDVLSMTPESGVEACPDVQRFFEQGELESRLVDDAFVSSTHLIPASERADATVVNIGWTVMRNCPDAAVLIWDTLEVEAINEAACAMVGLAAPSALIGKSITTLLEESSRQELTAMMSRSTDAAAHRGSAQATKDGRQRELQVRHVSGSILQVSFCIGGPLVVTNKRSVFVAILHDVTRIKQQEELLKREKERAETMLYQMIPKAFASRIRNGETRIADMMDSVTILFADLCGFTAMSSQQTPAETVEMLDALFTKFDECCEQFGVLKIKSIGDCILVASGVYREPDHVTRCIRFGKGIISALDEYNAAHGSSLKMRVGICTGPVIVGVIGRKMPILDVFSDTVNMASRMESNGIPNRIQLSRSSYEHVFTHPEFSFEERELMIKGKGMQVCYLLK